MTRAAAVDIGTNTVRLLVAEVRDAALEELDRRQEITRLGRGVDAARRLDPDAVSRTVEVVASHARRARELGARLRIAGTSALRDSADREDFARRVREATGTELEVLSGEEEGRLSFLGATAGLPSVPRVVCDIGGGSTEFVRGLEAAEAVWSMDVGSVRVRERCLQSDPPTEAEVGAARRMIHEGLEEVEVRLGPAGDAELIGVAGTVTTVAALVLGLERYRPERVHGARLGAEDVARWTERLLRMPTDEIRRLPTMQAGRADVIGAGALILHEVLDRWGLDAVRASERDILHGLVWSAAAGPR